MLITLCYVYLWLRFRACYALFIHSTVRRLHRSRSLAFCAALPRSDPGDEHVCLRLGNRVFLVDEFQLFDLHKWIPLLRSPYVHSGNNPGADQIAFVTEIISSEAENLPAVSGSSQEILKWSDYCLPVACSHDDPYKLVAETSVDNFSRLGIAFMENRLHMDNGMVPHKLVFHIKDSSVKELEQLAPVSEENPAEGTATGPAIPVLVRKIADQRSPVTDCSEENRKKGSQPPDEMGNAATEVLGAEDHHHLHLSSCHECLELENCTIESVRYASAENIPDLPDDYGGLEGNGDEVSLASQLEKAGMMGKPPNILLYVGSNPETTQTKVEQIKSVLMDCVSATSYVIYRLPEEQILTAPWPENCLLLVVAAEEPLSENVHQRILAYLSSGGKVLGLSTWFTFGGVRVKKKCSMREVLQTLVFTETESGEITFKVQTSGMVFEVQDGGKDSVEQWAHLNSEERDLMMVRLPYGDNEGEAILSQVQLEVSPSSLATCVDADFNELKLSNSRRCEVLTHILSSLGLNCERSEAPSLTPLYLLSSDEITRDSFLQWLCKKVDPEGVIKSSRMALRVMASYQPGAEVTPSLMPLVTQPVGFMSEHFSLEVYRGNLQTKKLGKIVLFSEVTSTTMDLLDGLILELPQEMGLIAIAAQQMQGKGRGGNAWLSPIGCAMFTLHLSIPLISQLGQRIAFIQHLMSLAVVESVRSLPGYQGIDMRVKWPNDIYYSDLMKLGGVLVSSTLTGRTFHVLIGCGFNVNNSNPTICINDLIMEYNRKNQTKLELLSTDCLIARTMTVLENLIDTFQDKGPSGILPLYYKYWVHSGRQVQLWNEEGPPAWIVGLDDNGFLQVHQDGQAIVTVHPDGNSFDMLKNLIIPKQR
ncbi:biotin--protein ligase isoform X2 [Rhinatrema bivittatum]|uniref:biotin--protein ligase isoform X2 n=1 Tax=Rhinatrema bivittatum TaxID=194408 RepID=UPI001128B02E|nr:biotin--protein ligase isoform X2 [Rhinatrema bivittatum]